MKKRVSDGARTRDNQSHSLALYQLSYAHHEKRLLYFNGAGEYDKGAFYPNDE